jgi:hypothetical protein
VVGVEFVVVGSVEVDFVGVVGRLLMDSTKEGPRHGLRRRHLCALDLLFQLRLHARKGRVELRPDPVDDRDDSKSYSSGNKAVLDCGRS